MISDVDIQYSHAIVYNACYYGVCSPTIFITVEVLPLTPCLLSYAEHVCVPASRETKRAWLMECQVDLW